MHLMLLGGFFIWFIETIILVFILTRKNENLISKRVFIFFGTGIITPIIFFVLLWLTMAGLQITNNINDNSFLDSWKAIPFGLWAFGSFFGCPILTMKIIIWTINKRKEKRAITRA